MSWWGRKNEEGVIVAPSLPRALYPGIHKWVADAIDDTWYGGLHSVAIVNEFETDHARFRVTFKDSHHMDLVVSRQDVVDNLYGTRAREFAQECKQYCHDTFGPGSWTTSLGATDWKSPQD